MDIDSALGIIHQGSFFSQAILYLLLGMSVLSWAMLILKFITLSYDHYASLYYVARVTGKSRDEAQAAAKRTHGSSSAARLYKAASRQRKLEAKSVPAVDRAVEAELYRVMNTLERGLGLLALTSSSAPFIGLLGTVVGIIITFQDISEQNTSSLAVVAPGISEALIATAAGLFVAIPALVGYNILQGKVRKLGNLLGAFQLNITNLFSS